MCLIHPLSCWLLCRGCSVSGCGTPYKPAYLAPKFTVIDTGSLEADLANRQSPIQLESRNGGDCGGEGNTPASAEDGDISPWESDHMIKAEETPTRSGLWTKGRTIVHSLFSISILLTAPMSLRQPLRRRCAARDFPAQSHLLYVSIFPDLDIVTDGTIASVDRVHPRCALPSPP